MTADTIQTDSLEIHNGDLAIAAYYARPNHSAPVPGVVVIQEIFGVNAHIRDVTERFAQAGYAAIAPAIYQRLAPGFEAGYTPEDITIGREYKHQTQADELLGDIQAALDFLKAQPGVKPGGYGCIGFCFGGHVAYLAATLADIAATASFYGAGITTLTPGGGSPTVTRTAAIKGTLHAFFGEEDASIPPEQVEQIAAALQQHGIPHAVHRYPRAGHGFFCDRRADYHPEAAADAWQRVLQLFSSCL
ncbi:MAG: dienelactone hydrolase family protein [Spirulinaceae cyanobacterium SM2_1_0]|nr:dienelactone hydrolase family protein [Spirulinaceae cyanobacterium SM2_1_0]